WASRAWRERGLAGSYWSAERSNSSEMIRADGHTASRPTALFFARVKPELLSLLEFYQQDIATLRSLGFDIRVETRLWPATLGSDSICFAWWWATAVPVVLARRFRRMPTIVTGATEFPETPLVKRWVKGLLTAIASRMADANIAISDFELDRLRSYHPRRLRRIYPSIDHEFYRPGRKSDSPSAAIVAQLNPISIKRKGVDLAIAAARLVNDKVPEFTLHIIGPVTTEGAQLLDMLVAKARAGSVVIHGEVDRETKRRLLQSSWFYLQPSTMEGFA